MKVRDFLEYFNEYPDADIVIDVDEINQVLTVFGLCAVVNKKDGKYKAVMQTAIDMHPVNLQRIVEETQKRADESMRVEHEE